MIGAGGLGSPVGALPGAAGVGTLGIVDFDVVDLSNLHRQILHGHDDIGKPKVDSARETLNDLQPGRQGDHAQRAAALGERDRDHRAQYDIIVNGADNFAARYLVNDACVLPQEAAGRRLASSASTARRPSICRARAATAASSRRRPRPGWCRSCAEAGVLGALCGMIGSIQATETLKLILGIGEPLIGRLLLYDALAMEIREVKIRRDPKCPLCGDNPTITELIDYEEFCGTAPVGWHRRSDAW